MKPTTYKQPTRVFIKSPSGMSSGRYSFGLYLGVVAVLAIYLAWLGLWGT